MQYNIGVPVNGKCEPANRGNFYTLSSTSSGLCDSGTVINFSGSGPWNWTCEGSNGGSSDRNCSARLKVDGACGSANRGNFYTLSHTSSGLCAGTLSSFSGSGPWNWTCEGSNDGNPVDCSANLKVDGACGSSNGKTLTTKPTSDLCGDGTLPTVSASGPPWTWTCAGTNGGNPLSCSTLSVGTPDLDFTRSWGSITGFSSSCSGNSGVPCSITVAIVNNGNGAAGPFTVKVWFTTSGNLDSNAQLLSTWNVSGLAAGQILTHTFSNLVYYGGVHATNYMVLKMDPDNLVTNEVNKSNNALSWGIFMYR